jgi:FkbM family methyltransferase
MTTGTLVGVNTAGGHRAVFDVRLDTSDGALVHGIIEGKEYDLPTGLSGWAIDIGAHIGIVTVALALDNPDLRIVAVEALPENVEQLRANVKLNGLEDRVVVLQMAAGKDGETEVAITYGWSKAENQPDHYMSDNRFIGGMVGGNETSDFVICTATSLRDILDAYHIEEVALLKIDCEGCEWFFLDSPALSKVDRIIGEMHIGRHGQAADLRRLLADFDVTMDDSLVVATFEAVRR